MAKTIEFKYDGKDYVLEFNRRTMKELEENGFNAKTLGALSDGTIDPLDAVDLMLTLFEGAFKMHHKNVKKQTIEAIWKTMPNKEGLLEQLSEIYIEPVESLMSDPKPSEDGSKNVTEWNVYEY